MAPCRQLLMWSVPSIAVLLGIFWFKKKREYAKSDPGGRERIKSLQEELAEALSAEAEIRRLSPLGKADRSLIKSAPIDIIPNGTGSQRSSLELTDEEVDLEIEKIIRKKSLDKEKKMSVGSDNYMESVKVKENPCVIKEVQCDIYSSFRIDMTCESRENLCSTKINEDCGTSIAMENDHDEVSVINSQVNTPKLEVFPSQSNLSENTTDNKSEDLTATNNETEESRSREEQMDVQDTYSDSQPRRISERDSANHSPVDPMLASPSMCHFSDDHSEGSSDSGKGCSEAASPPPTNMNIIPSEAGLRIHQFLIPTSLVGLLIGKCGSFVTCIKAKTGATVYVRRHPELSKQKICAIEGTQSEIEAALEMIKDKFPEKRFPNFTTQEISAELYQRLAPLVPEYLQLQLVESVNNDTILTCLVSAGHFFLQQPLHPTFPSLHVLHRLMVDTYQNPDVPTLPRPVKEGSICAAPTENNWYRAQVLSTSEETETSVVKLVDYGGYLTVDNDQLKQIRSDFMTVPFQATEALLAFVKPANNEPDWSSEALRIMAGLTAGQMLHAQVAGYDETGLPLVHLYLTLNPQQVIYLNRELVERGLAEWEAPADS
ncbi:unnamed protein product [Pieris macdunnoughi]|uniref:Tudor domain-containing protein n=1 Tax=Pieris macdunnoughi TaxID=345717 RepID=A0A821MNF5_9NEOP|nr:unnamed protein product [Pieris macdunnoughi]